MVDLPPASKPDLNFITTNEIRSRPIKSTMGVLPVRRSESIPELNLVHLRGRSVNVNVVENSTETETGHIGANTPRTPRRSFQPVENQSSTLPERRNQLPAILPVVGTTHTATLQERRAPLKPIVHVPPVKKRKIDVVVVDTELPERNTPRSLVDRMVQEARIMAHSAGDRGTPRSRVSSKQQ